MDDNCIKVLNMAGLAFEKGDELDGILIQRELLLNNEKYKIIKNEINGLKKVLSSSSLTALHQTADTSQKWPLLNLVRQILSSYKYNMEPIRKSDGYTKDGIKKYKRFFQIKKN